MSLVAYYGSEESDASDTDEQEAPPKPKPPLSPTSISEASSKGNSTVEDQEGTGHISDEDEFESVSSTSTSAFIHSDRWKESQFKNNPVDLDRLGSRSRSMSAFDNEVNSTSITSLEDLPVPQSKSGDLKPEIIEEELEEEVRPKVSEIANAPKPPGPKSRQPVKITIPSLEEVPDNSQQSKRAVSSTATKSSLFSLLPAPVHSAKKEINRPLIPHSLTKKSVSSKVAKAPTSQSSVDGDRIKEEGEVASSSDISSKHMTQFNALTGYDSDSDDDDHKNNSANFFSLSSNSSVKNNAEDSSAAASRLQSEEISSSKSELKTKTENSPLVSEKCASAQNDVTEGPSKSSSDVEDEPEPEPEPEPGSMNDAPLDFRSVNRLNMWSGNYGFLNPVGRAGPVVAHRLDYAEAYSLPSNTSYNLANTEIPEPQEVGDVEMDVVPNDDLKQFMSDKEFQRLQGKRKRGLEEAINFVDAKVDDYVDPTEISKHLTEETEYSSHKSKDNQPTSQQKRKKQITYLAYQAKEREMELKNTWADNRMTKKQTQSKYGF